MKAFLWSFFKTILGLACIILFFTLGYYASTYICSFLNIKSNLVSNVLSSVLGIIIFGCSMKLLSEILQRTHGDHTVVHRHLIDDTIKAMEKISKGNFDVLLKINKNEPFHEVALSVNKMAQNLNSMEKLRQDFVSNVSHEIQSPLTSICGFASLLRDNHLTKEKRDHYLNIIETESTRLSKLSDNLLKLSSLESEHTPFDPTSFRLDKQLENIILLLEPQWNKKSINLDVSLSKVTINGDKDLLSQVWINLLQNSIKFTPNEGLIKIYLTSDDNTIKCEISDNGSGIPKESLSHIFERFYKVDRSRNRSVGGNGLGLSLVKKIVEIHKGDIEVKSEIGIGSSFIIILPI